jgi:tRNA G46 methylase TrmB
LADVHGVFFFTMAMGPPRAIRYTFAMDLSHVDIASLARQLRHPEGEMGKQVGTVMARFNAPANAFVFEQLRIQPMDRVLEIGFGPGEALAEASRLTPTGFVAGIDGSETMLRMAEDRNRRAITI